MKLHKIAFWLLIIGGLNWGLMVLGYDIARWIPSTTIVTIVYVLVGLSALYEAFGHGKKCKECMA